MLSRKGYWDPSGEVVSMYVMILMYITSRLYIVCVQMVYTEPGVYVSGLN